MHQHNDRSTYEITTMNISVMNGLDEPWTTTWNLTNDCPQVLTYHFGTFSSGGLIKDKVFVTPLSGDLAKMKQIVTTIDGLGLDTLTRFLDDVWRWHIKPLDILLKALYQTDWTLLFLHVILWEF